MTQSPDSDTVTDGIRVQASARFVPDQSDPERSQYLFAYRIVIRNEGTKRAKLLSRHWIIIDADNQREEVKGPGVVGETPDLAPGQSFEYESACPLTTAWGTMEGSYRMQLEGGATLEARIGRFFLTSKSALKKSPR
jgi:ApaG protein